MMMQSCQSASHDQEELFDRIMRGDYEYLSPFWDDVSEGPKDLIDCLLKVDADDRYSPEQVLSHEWIRKWVEPFDTEVTTAVEKPKPKGNRKSLRGISIAIQSLMCLLKLVRSRREKNLLDAAAESTLLTPTTTAMATTESLSSSDATRADNDVISPPHTPVSGRSRIPRPKPSAGFHIAEIRKSIVTPTRGKREPDCALKNGILKRDEAIRRVNRSESTRLYHVKTNPTVSAATKYAKLRPSSAASIKRNNTNETEMKRPCNPRRSKPSTQVQTDQDIQALLHKKLYGDSKIFGHLTPYGDNQTYNDEKMHEDNNSYGDNTTDEEKGYEENKANYPENMAVVLTTKVIRKPSVDKTTREPPIRKSSTRFRPRSMLGDANTVKASSEMNISSRTTERNIHERKKSYDNQKYPPTTKKAHRDTNSNHNKNINNNKHSSPTTPSPTKLSNGYHCSGSDEDQFHESESQPKCECPSNSRTVNQASSSSSSPQTDVDSHSNDIHGNSSSNCSNDSLNSNGTSNSIRKSRSSCRKIPSRKPVCRHASSIQSIPAEKYTPRRGLYRVKSLESNHVPSLNHGAGSISVGVGTGGTKGCRTYHENGLPPWNPSTNLNNRFIPCSPREQQQEKKNSPSGGVRTPRGSESRGLEPKCVTKAATEADKGIKITTEVNKRKNTKFPDGKTVDEEVKTTTTVSVNMESPEEEKETSLLTKVKNLALEIGSLAKETYKLSQSSGSSDSLEKENSLRMGSYSGNNVNIEGYTAENGREDSSDFNDDSLASNKEETDIHSETEYLSSVFRKK